MPQTHLQELITWASGFSLEDAPPEVHRRAHHVVLNNIGCLILGSESESQAPLVLLASLFGTSDEAFTPVVEGAVASATAAMINASLINSTELSEGVSKGVVHPGTVLVPALLAEGERLGASGADVLTALVAGYESLIRLGWALAHDPDEPLNTVQAQSLHRGWYPPAILGGLGSAIAVGRLHGLSAEQIEHAVGIAGNLAPTTLLSSFKSGVAAKSLGTGWASALGILSARLAADGYSGSKSVIDELFPMIVTPVDLERVSASLGSVFEIMTLDVKFAAAGPVLCEIECAIQMREQWPLDVSEIEAIDVEANARTMLLDGSRPATPSAAKFSAPYCIAQALLGRTRDEMMVEAFEYEAIRDDNWHELADRVTLHFNEEFDRLFEEMPPRLRPTRLTLTMRDGSTVSHGIEGAVGIPGFPPSETDFVRKYRYLADRHFDAETVQRQVDTILALDGLESVTDLTSLLKGPRSA